MKDNTSKKIDTQYIHLMDDYEVIDNFPWGPVAYDFLVTNIRSRCGRTTIERRKKNKEVVTHMDINGFSYALQFWAYEVIPFVANLCATRKSASSIPHMLRWSSEKFIR